MNGAPGPVGAAVEHLQDLALVWQATGGLRALTGVGEAMVGGPGAGVSGLRSFSSEPASVGDLTRRLGELSAAARAMLQHVDQAGGEATAGSARTTVSPQQAATPAEELISRRLLVPRGGGQVVLPGEVAVELRGGHTTRDAMDDVPVLATSERSRPVVDHAAAGAAFEAVRRVELLLDHWGDDPPTVLRSGGLGVRDLKAAAALVQADEPTAALLVETAWGAGLLATTADLHGNPTWVPTDAFDAWTELAPARRWVALARTWWESQRVPSAVGSRDSAGKTWNALVPELHNPWVTESRRLTLAALGELPDGEVLAAGTGLPSMVARVSWQRPRRPRLRAEQVAWATLEASVLGLTGLGGLASYAALLVAGDQDRAADALATLLPEPIDHVLLQADLTAVAPGPLETGLARRLQLIADVESRGGATVYRFTPASVRRGLDTGWTAVELHGFLAGVSRTPVPQPLTYLVDDTARTFGTVRVGHAESFVRADDEAALTELMHHPRAAGLGLRRLAPTVLISSTPLDLLLPRLRDLGAAPAVEAEDGTLRVLRPESRRARTPRARRVGAVRAARQSVRVSQVVTAVRAGDRVAATDPSPSAPLTATGSLSALREALETGTSVLISYVDNQGTSSERIVDPISVEGGTLVARDHRTDAERSFAVHRISGVRAL
ncbi:MAG: helicase C-terminal domain-containing protein [Nocardioides sp.]|nr:helicase C-terminal domain-containing protein [Nocardioides sp.]